MKASRINGGWIAAFTGWIISSVLFPFLPEIMNVVIDGIPLGIFFFSPMEYFSTMALWSVVFLLVWIPSGLRAGRLYRDKGIKPARNFVIIVFLLLLAALCIMFRFFWNS